MHIEMLQNYKKYVFWSLFPHFLVPSSWNPQNVLRVSAVPSAPVCGLWPQLLRYLQNPFECPRAEASSKEVAFAGLPESFRVDTQHKAPAVIGSSAFVSHHTVKVVGWKWIFMRDKANQTHTLWSLEFLCWWTHGCQEGIPQICKASCYAQTLFDLALCTSESFITSFKLPWLM